jgi:hypothetical protein
LEGQLVVPNFLLSGQARRLGKADKLGLGEEGIGRIFLISGQLGGQVRTREGGNTWDRDRWELGIQRRFTLKRKEHWV